MSPPKQGRISILGIDHSISNTAIAVIELERTKKKTWRVVRIQADTYECCGDDIVGRLQMLYNVVKVGIFSVISDRPKVVVCGVENLSRGSMFRREEMGMSFAIAILALRHFVNWKHVRLITPRMAKEYVCPHWAGLSKKNWLVLKRTAKFKMTLPDKTAVRSALYRRFGIKVGTDHESDAAAIALAAFVNQCPNQVIEEKEDE